MGEGSKIGQKSFTYILNGPLLLSLSRLLGCLAHMEFSRLLQIFRKQSNTIPLPHVSCNKIIDIKFRNNNNLISKINHINNNNIDGIINHKNININIVNINSSTNVLSTITKNNNIRAKSRISYHQHQQRSKSSMVISKLRWIDAMTTNLTCQII